MPQKKKNNLVTILLAIFLLVVILGAFYYFWSNRSVDNNVQSELLPTVIFKKVDAETIKGLGELRACGDWPILTVGPDKDRGNPFDVKNEEVGPVFGTVTPECLPVKFK